MHHAERLSQRLRYFGERISLAHQVCPANVGCQVFVAKIEPCVHAVGVESFESSESLACDTPSGFGVGQSGKCVHHSVHIRGHVQTVKLLVVAGVDDDGQTGRRQDLRQAERELSATYAARECEPLHRAPAQPIPE